MGAMEPEERTPVPAEPLVDADDLSSAEFDTGGTQETVQRALPDETLKKIQAKEEARRILEQLERYRATQDSDDSDPSGE